MSFARAIIRLFDQTLPDDERELLKRLRAAFAGCVIASIGGFALAAIACVKEDFWWGVFFVVAASATGIVAIAIQEDL